MLLATPVNLPPQTVHALYADRWPIAPLPLARKPMVAAQRQFLLAPETRQRLPELALLADSLLTGLAALHPTLPTGFGDRKPQPTPGRFRRALRRRPFPQSYPLPEQLCQKAAVTDHWPKGILGHRRQKRVAAAVLT